MAISRPEILVIQSDVSELKKVEYFLNDILTKNILPVKYFNKLYLCVSEAVINAIRHGNRNDFNKKVIVKVHCSAHEINVLVEDEGDGFDVELLKNPTEKENIRKESGRGIFIIKNLTEYVNFNDKGNSIQFKIKYSE